MATYWLKGLMDTVQAFAPCEMAVSAYMQL